MRRVASFLKEADPGDHRIPHQPLKLGFVLVGQNQDVFSGTGVVELLSASSRRGMTVRQATLPAMHPGRAAEVILDGEVIGFVGELHPSVARDVGLDGRVVVGEMDLDPLVATQDDWRLADVSRVPSTCVLIWPSRSLTTFQPTAPQKSSDRRRARTSKP